MRAFSAAPARCARHRGLADKTRRTWRAILRDARVPGAFRSRHRQLVLARMRALSLVLAVLTLAWIPVDVVVLGSSYAGLAAPLRIVLALTLWAWPRAAQRLPLGFAVNGFAWLQAIPSVKADGNEPSSSFEKPPSAPMPAALRAMFRAR